MHGSILYVHPVATSEESGLKKYAVAVVSVVVSLIARAALAPYLGDTVPYLHLFPAIFIASWYGGFGPGSLATLLSAVTALYYFLPPANSLRLLSATDALSLALFITIGVAIARLSGQLREAHEHARSEAGLAKARAERLDAIITTSVDGIIVIDPRGNIESVNPAAVRLFGYREDEAVGRNVSMLMPSPYHEEHDSYLARYTATGEKKIIGIGREVTGRRKDGTTFPLHLSVGETVINGQRRFTGILHDLSSRVVLEGQLRERRALARLGEMAAVIAHEVKNPLAGIRGAVQVIAGRMNQDSPDTAMMTEIVKRIDSLDAMMKDLLVFARPPNPKRAPTEVVPLLAATARLLKEDAGAREVEVEISGAAPPVQADGEMLKMVFQNLLLNGAHAMQGKGTIRVRVADVDHVCHVAVSDHGPGIPAEVREKIFMPFFTTKRRGSGLGLPTAKRFIEAQDGRITVECPPSGGTTVTVQLPLA